MESELSSTAILYFLLCGSTEYSIFPAYSQVVLFLRHERKITKITKISFCTSLGIAHSTKMGFPDTARCSSYCYQYEGHHLARKNITDKDLSNPFCSPRFRVSVSGSPQQTAFAFGVPDHINGFHPYLVGSVCL